MVTTIYRYLQTSIRNQFVSLLLATIVCISLSATASASPFGQGVFGADVPFGSGTSMSIALGGNVAINLTPSGPNYIGSGSHTLTVTSTDVVGYRLYIYSPSSSTMTNGSETIDTSANVTPGALADNTWGYNIDASSNYRGITTSPVVLIDAIGPYKNGNNTTITYGVVVDKTKGAGDYNVSVVYTAVAKSQ